MKVLTKEIRNDIDLQEIRFAVDSKRSRTMPVFFLNEDNGVTEAEIKTVRTEFNKLSDKENELRFMIIPATFTFFTEHDSYALEREMHSPESDFLSQYVNRLRIISYLPEEILSEVKDKRLLAMGFSDKKVKKAILRYTDAKIKTALEILENSLKESLKAAEGLTIEKQFEEHSYIYSIEELFDEAFITSVCKKEKDLYVELNGEDTFVLTNVETLEDEIDPKNTEVSFFELYKVEKGYELHFLLKIKDNNLAESFHYVTYGFKDMRFSDV